MSVIRLGFIRPTVIGECSDGQYMFYSDYLALLQEKAELLEFTKEVCAEMAEGGIVCDDGASCNYCQEVCAFDERIKHKSNCIVGKCEKFLAEHKGE